MRARNFRLNPNAAPAPKRGSGPGTPERLDCETVFLKLLGPVAPVTIVKELVNFEVVTIGLKFITGLF